MRDLNKAANYYTTYSKSIVGCAALIVDLQALELNLESLIKIKKRLQGGKTVLRTFQSLDQAIEEAHSRVDQIRKVIAKREKENYKCLVNIYDNYEDRADKIRLVASSSLPEISKMSSTSTERNIRNLKALATLLKRNTVDRNAGLTLSAFLEQTKADTIKAQQNVEHYINDSCLKTFEELVKKRENILGNAEKEKMMYRASSDVEKEASFKLNNKIQDALETLETNSTNSLELKNYLDKKVLETLAPNQLALCFDRVPYWKKLTIIRKNELEHNKWIEAAHGIASTKSLLVCVNERVLVLNQKIESYRSFLNTARLNYINADKLNNMISLTLERIQSRAAILQKNTHMTETLLLAKKELISNKTRKRKFFENDSFVESKLEAIKKKRQKVLEFVVQRKSAMLGNVHVSDTLSVLEKSQEKLENHSVFLSFILDPIETVKKRGTITTELFGCEHFSPTTIESLKFFIKKVTSEATVSLHEQIKSLQKQVDRK